MQPPSTYARRRAALVGLLLAAYAGLLLAAISALEEHGEIWLEANFELLLRSPLIPFLTGLILVSPILFLGIYLFILGSRAWRAERLPPPGYTVAFKARVYTGVQAKWRARVIQLLSALILFCALAIPLILLALVLTLRAAA